MRFDPSQALLLLSHGLLDLGPAQPQHSPKLLDRDSFREDPSDLLEAEADVAQGDDAVQSLQLANAVVAVAAGWVDPLGPEESEVVIVAQHARRHLTESGELSDVQHGRVIDRPSHGVKVKIPGREMVSGASGGLRYPAQSRR